MTETAYGTVELSETGVSIRANFAQLCSWSTRPGHSWPCSTLDDLPDGIRADFDAGGLIDLDAPSTFYDNWSGLYYERMEGEEFSGESYEIAGDEFNAWSSDVLRDVLPRDHPAYEVCVGQFSNA